MARSTVSAVTPWPVRMMRHQLVEQPLDEGDLGGLAPERDLVAAHVDVGVEGLLDEGEVLVAGAEQATMGMLLGTTTVCLVRGAAVALGVCHRGLMLRLLTPAGHTAIGHAQGRVTSRRPRHISSVVPSPHTTYRSSWPSNAGSRSRSDWSCRQVTRGCRRASAAPASPGGALVVEVPDRDVEHLCRPVDLDLDRAAEQVHVPGGGADRHRLA